MFGPITLHQDVWYMFAMLWHWRGFLLLAFIMKQALHNMSSVN
jgi:hypothetical protein